jgi:hypothetical protein
MHWLGPRGSIALNSARDKTFEDRKWKMKDGLCGLTRIFLSGTSRRAIHTKVGRDSVEPDFISRACRADLPRRNTVKTGVDEGGKKAQNAQNLSQKETKETKNGSFIHCVAFSSILTGPA